MKKIIFSLFLILMIGTVYADTNGIWQRAEDIREGIFGSDENATFFQFIDPVEFNTNLNEAITAFSLNNHAIFASTNATGKSAIYGFTENNNSYSGYFEGGELRVDSGNMIVNTGNVGIGVLDPQERLEIAGNIKANDIYSNGEKVATENFVLENVIDTVVSVTSGSTDSTYIYDCPYKPSLSGTVYIKDRGYVDYFCNSQCFGLSSQTTCRAATNYYNNRCQYENFMCEMVGTLVQPSGLITLEFPSNVVIDIPSAQRSYNETYSFTLPSSFVNSVKLNKVTGFLGYTSGHGGGSGYDSSKTRYLWFTVKNGDNVITSDVLSSTSISTQELISLDFGGKEITNQNLEIQFFFSGGDDDEWIDYTAANFYLVFSGDIGSTTELSSN